MPGIAVRIKKYLSAKGENIEKVGVPTAWAKWRGPLSLPTRSLRDLLRCLKIAAYPQRIGQLASNRGDIEGIIFTSTKLANTLNLVIFPERVRPLSIVELYDPQNELK